MESFIRRILFLAVAGPWSVVQAQQIDLSLHATATPDSFEVRARATSGVFTAVPNAVLTMRWEVASGGVANNGDVRRGCDAYSILNYGGSVDVGAYRYFTLVLFGDRSLDEAGCKIDTAGMVLCTVRIRQMAGCRSVSLVENAYTGMNNLDYYFSIGGAPVTGEIVSAPISAGDCSACVPPVIGSAQVDGPDPCGHGPVDFQVEATGTDLEYSWGAPSGTWVGFLPNGSWANGVPGAYTVMVSNACGTTQAVAYSGPGPEECRPAELQAVWFQALPPYGQQVRLHAQGTGTCLSYQWQLPNGAIINGNSPMSAPVTAHPGMYTCILVSACGTDTMQLVLPNGPLCPAPEIQQVTSSLPMPLCGPASVILQAQTTMPVTYEWSAPSGPWVPGPGSLVLDPPQQGLYRVRATNVCGIDSASFLVELDTIGLASCIPPVINGFSSDLVCTGAPVDIHADVVASDRCLKYSWGGVWSGPQGPTLHLSEANVSTISLTVTNACGSAYASYEVPVVPLEHIWQPICGQTAPVLLDSLYADRLVEGGFWRRNDGDLAGVFQPVQDSSAWFLYILPDGCAHLKVWMVAGLGHEAGEDASIRVCSNEDPVDLFPLLGPDADSGGIWFYGYAHLAGGIYDPGQSYGTFTQVFGYYVGDGSGHCDDYAYVTVEGVEATFPWYADLDGDGLGDLLDRLLSCDPVYGRVQNAGDACPLLFGTVGDPCDDGNASTYQDVISEDCICAGELNTGVERGTGSGWRLWPNPAQEQVSLSCPLVGRVNITVMDASGSVVQDFERTVDGAPIKWSMNGLASGVYTIRARSSVGSQVLRLVVQ